MCFGAKLQQAQIVVKDDFHRAWAWTGTLASNIDEKEGPQIEPTLIGYNRNW
jgi:hypothetical protein